ncbi:accessory gene regulator ArgB-like protein [Clostridium sp.]|uniref:accessory gene regulator ArgB-like protein n=1 Tax=Clostridium sp. TaxID=1506 RepID=UPI003F3196F3
MFSLGKISESIANKVATDLEYDKDKKDVIAYGIFALLQTVISILLVVVFGIIFDVLIEALIMSFAISILRKSSGGVHATSPGICALIGTFICIIVPIMIPVNRLNIINTTVFGVLVFILSFYLVNKLAPVDSKSKPIKTESKRKRLKRSSIIILCVYLIITMVSICLYYFTSNVSFLSYCICIYAGLLWQVFSLTKSGHTILGKLDALLHKILKNGGE